MLVALVVLIRVQELCVIQNLFKTSDPVVTDKSFVIPLTSCPLLASLASQQIHELSQKFNVDFHMLIFVDLRVVLTWDTDMTDLELIVSEPNDEKCSAFLNHTKNGTNFRN